MTWPPSINERFGERIIVGKFKTEYLRGGQLYRYALCRCDAGHEVWVRADKLKSGSGGVCRKCHCKRIATRHGEAGRDRKAMTPVYRKWVDMIARVNNDESYVRRGIGVCERWKIFENFKSDMGDPPDSRMELDRKDGQKGYSPNNCRWLTRSQNNKNRTNLRMVSFDGITMCVADWEKYLNLPPDKLRKKLRFKRPLATIMAECGFTAAKLPFLQ